MRCYFTGRRRSATSAERRARGFGPFAGMIRWDSSFFSAFRARSARTALRRSCGPSAVLDLPRNQTPLPHRWQRGRAATVGCVREATPPLRGALLVLFSRQGEKSTQIKLPDKAQFISHPPQNNPAHVGGVVFLSERLFGLLGNDLHGGLEVIPRDVQSGQKAKLGLGLDGQDPPRHAGGQDLTAVPLGLNTDHQS